MVFLKLFTCREKAVKILTLCSIRTFHKKMALLIFYPTIYSFSTSLFVFVACVAGVERGSRLCFCGYYLLYEAKRDKIKCATFNA